MFPGMGLPGSVLIGQIQKLPEITDHQAGRMHLVPGRHDVADIGGKSGDGGKIQYKLIHCDLPPKEHGDQHSVGEPVPQEDNAQIRQPGKKLPAAELFLPGHILIEQRFGQLLQPVRHTVDTDILCSGKICGAIVHIIQPPLDVGTFRPGFIFILLISADTEQIDQRRNGKKQHQPRTYKRDHRSEQTVAKRILQQIHALLGYFQQINLAVEHPYGTLGTSIQIPCFFLFIRLVKAVHGFFLQPDALAEAITAHIGIQHYAAEIAQDRGRQGRSQQYAHRQRRMPEGLPGSYFRYDQRRQFDLCPCQKNGKRHPCGHQPEGLRRSPEHFFKAPYGIAPCGTIWFFLFCFRFQRA